MSADPIAVRVYSTESESQVAERCRLLHEFTHKVDQFKVTERGKAARSVSQIAPGLAILDGLPELAEPFLKEIHTAELPVVVILLLDDPEEHGHAFLNRLYANGLLSVESRDVLDDRLLVNRILALSSGRLRQLGVFENYRTLVEHSQDIITVVDASGIIRYESPSIQTVLGYDPEELIGLSPFPLIHPEDRPAIMKLFNEDRTAVGKTETVTYRFKHANGDWIHLESRAKVFEFSHGESGIVISSRDISERLSALELLESRERQLEEAEQLTHIGSWRWNPSTDELEWSSEMYRIYGFEVGSPLSMSRFKESIHPADRDHVDQVISTCLNSREPYVMTHRIIRPDGSERILEGRGELRQSDDRHEEILVGTGRDITEQVTASEAMKRSEQHFRSLFESSPDGIVVLDTQGNVQDVNSSAIVILGYPKEELLGQPLSDIWNKADPFPPSLVRDVLEGKVERMTKRIEREGSTHHIEITFGFLNAPTGRRPTLFLRDVTNGVESREMLRRLGRHQQDLLERERQRISREVHDVIGQELTALKMDVEWVANHLEDGNTPESLHAIASKINETIHTARRIAHELRPAILDDFGLAAAVEWYAKTLEKRSGLEFKFGTLEHDPLPDDLQLTVFRICQELLTNVVRHADADQVMINIASVGQNLSISVTDNGRGLPEMDSGRSSLGMLGIKERLGPWNGRLELTSKNGNGTRAEIIIPLSALEAGDPS